MAAAGDTFAIGADEAIRLAEGIDDETDIPLPVAPPPNAH